MEHVTQDATTTIGRSLPWAGGREITFFHKALSYFPTLAPTWTICISYVSGVRCFCCPRKNSLLASMLQLYHTRRAFTNHSINISCHAPRACTGIRLLLWPSQLPRALYTYCLCGSSSRPLSFYHTQTETTRVPKNDMSSYVAAGYRVCEHTRPVSGICSVTFAGVSSRCCTHFNYLLVRL